MKSALKYFFILLFSSTLFACSSGGGGGDDDPDEAKITAANEKQLGLAAAQGAIQAVDNVETSGTVGFRPSARQSAMQAINSSLPRPQIKGLAYVPMPIPNLCTTGSATQDVDSSGSAVVVFSNCEILAGPTSVFADGTINVTVTEGSNTTRVRTQYVNFTLTIDAMTETIDFSSDCTINNNTFDISCTYTSTALGLDGRTYTTSGAVVTGDDSSGYTVSVTVTDPDFGTVSINTSQPILFNCAGSQPSSGQLTFSDADGVVVTVTFNDCTSFTVSYSGTSNTYTY